MKVRFIGVGMAWLALAGWTWAGPYAASGIPANDPAFVGWATGVAELVRGPQDIANPASPLASFGSAANALGAPGGTFDVVSLGDGGWITLTFASPIYNGPGPDFAVFENGFGFNGLIFGELAFVEVSSNGVDFFRFPSVSLTQTATQLSNADGIDPTAIHNLAGKFPAREGTPFDLQDLVGVSPLLDVHAITHVRIIDVVGSLDPQYRRLDSQGNPINDPWPTDFASSGFDLDAVGVIHQTPEPSALVLWGLGGLGIGWTRWRRRRAS
ncbi:MAG: PEP-CTERM sorting domain-containing protein [Gemmataceae bacterium]